MGVLLAWPGPASADAEEETAREKVWQNEYRPTPAPRTVNATALIEIERPPSSGNPFFDVDSGPMTRAIARELSQMFTHAGTTKTGGEQIIVRVTGLNWFSSDGWSRVMQPTVVLLDPGDGRELFRASRRSRNELRAYYLDVAEVFGELKGDLAGAFDRPEIAALIGGAGRRAASVISDPGGLYDIERDLVFNTLDAVEFDAENREVILIEHYDERFGGRRIPYLQHLAALLDRPDPEFSLDWTPQSERQVAAFLRRMDSIEEMRALDSVSGQWLGADGLPTAQGRVMLPLFGVKPTRNGRGSGSLGVSVSYNAARAGLQVDRIARGSPAERAGLRIGDVIQFFDKKDVPYPSELVRAASFAGAGAGVTIQIVRAGTQPVTLHAILDESRDDPWRHITRYDIAAQMLRQIGMKKAANVLESLDLSRRLVNTPAAMQAVYATFSATETWQVHENVMAAQKRGEMALPEAQRRMQRAVVAGTEDAFRLPPGSLTAYFDAAMRRGMTSSQAFTEGMLHLDEKIEPLLKNMLRTLLQRNDEIVLPVSAIERRMGGRPEVVLRFDGVAPDSALARMMFEADYLGKSLLHRPDLSTRIPGYKTEYAFDADHARSSAASVTRRMWISIDALATRQTADGKRLLLGEPSMRFNIREEGGRTLQSNEYGNLLTSLYGPLSKEFPVLHELSEAAKLAHIAQWIAGKAPDFRLPAEGRSQWKAPSQVPGIVYLIWSPKRVTVAMVAAGGVSLKVPPIGPSGPVVPLKPYPVTETSVVDLSDREAGSLTVRPQPFDNSTLTRVLGKKIDVPVPRPNGWVARADKGARTALALAVPPAGAACRPNEASALDRQLAEARVIARQLTAVEDAINTITQKNPTRQEAAARIASDLSDAQDAFVKNALDVLTQGMFDTFDGLEKEVAGTGLEDLYRGASAMNEARNGLQAVSGKLSRIRLAFDTASADDIDSRQKVVSELVDLAGDLLSDGKILGNTPTRRVMQKSLATLNRAKGVKDIVELAGPLAVLAGAAKELRTMSGDTDHDLGRLKETLLPAQRRLSDRLIDAMKAPAVKAWTEGESSGVCRAAAG